MGARDGTGLEGLRPAGVIGGQPAVEPQPPTSRKGHRPTHTAYTLRDFTPRRTRARLTPHGSKPAWDSCTENGKGFDVWLNLLPANGHLGLRYDDPKPKNQD